MKIRVMPEWPTGSPDDLAMLIAQGRGTIELDDSQLREIPPVWWRRLYNWLTPWRPHTRVFVRAPKDFWNPPEGATPYYTADEIRDALRQARDAMKQPDA